MDGEVKLDEWLDPLGESYNPALGLATIWTAFAIDHEAMALPVNLLLGEYGELSDAQSSIKEEPDNQEFLTSLPGRCQSVSFITLRGS